jgi:tRNA(adenine34) deaminase
LGFNESWNRNCYAMQHSPPYHEQFMKEALKEARVALSKNEIPVGAVVVCQGKIIARAHNLTEELNDVTAHAEMQAITAATNYIWGKHLSDCTLYVTLEPCIMCGGACFLSQLGTIVFGTRDEKRGYSSLQENILHPKTEVIHGILEKDCRQLMQAFFNTKRR